MSKVGLTVRWLVVPLSFIAFNPSTMAASFPSAGVDVTASLGQFTLRLTKEGGNMLGIPGCPSASDCLIESPVLYDPDTQIGRSDPFIEPNPLESDGAPVCITGSETSCTTFGNKVKDSQLHFPSSGFVEGPIGTEEVHTQILSLNMTNGGYAVRLNPNKRSIGEVESKGTDPTDISNGFPAESFFNVYVEIEANIGGITLFNKAPLIIQNGNLMSFPPEVVYIHGGSNSVAVYDKANPNGPRIAGVVLAGHGLQPNLTDQILCSSTAGATVAAGGCINKEFIDNLGKDLFKDLGPEMPFPLLVKLNSLIATVQDSEVTIDFETASEQDVLGLELWRGEPINGECTADLLNYINLNMVGEVNSVGSETMGAAYQITDSVAAAGTYCYALKEVDEKGNSTWINHVAKAIIN